MGPASQNQTAIQAPGKLILSGEHAVVHGQPALAMAVNRYAQITSQPATDSVLRFCLPEFDTELAHTLSDLPAFVQQRLTAYAEFTEGKRPIADVLDEALDIIPLAFALGAGPELANVSGRKFTIQIEIPVGCGMGSSAAVGLVAAAAGAQAAKRDYELQELLEWSLTCERCIHGHPSGVDSYVCLHGGAVRFADGQTNARTPPTWDLNLLDTGRPTCSTGECVVRVGRRFPGHDPIWNEFGAITDAIDDAMAGPVDAVLPLIRENHALLCRIGVVPEPVQKLIAAIENQGGAAKVCGAGSVGGDAGGVVLALGELDVTALCKDWQVNLVPCAPTRTGVAQL